MRPPQIYPAQWLRAIERLAADVWQIEAALRFGFAFIQRSGERRLLVLTPRDPHDTGPQSFNPFRRESRSAYLLAAPN